MRWVTVTRHAVDAAEAEPMLVEVEDGRLALVLDDGERLEMDARELVAELDYEMAADALAQAQSEAA